jgi:DNA-binding transcriptional LysR family regulator
VAVNEEGHLTRAADRLHLSQPAVSAHIKALEQILDLKLFERSATGMTPTAAGQAVVDHAQRVLAAVDALRRGAAELKGELIGTLRVGSVSDPQSNRVGDLLAVAVSRYPRLQIELHHAVSGAALQAVRERELDATFYFGEMPGTEFVALPLKQIVYRVAGPAAWADRIRHADWAAISALPWVRTPAISTHNQLVQQLFARYGIDVPPHRIEADSESLIIDLLVSGVGVSLVREDAARPRAQAGELVLWPQAKLRTTLWFVCAASRAEDALLRALLACVRETWGRG